MIVLPHSRYNLINRQANYPREYSQHIPLPQAKRTNIQRMASSYSYLFKYIIIGDTSVGKSCLLLQFLERKFKLDHDTTIGVEFGSKILTTPSSPGRPIKLQIWDTAGQQTFISITRSYYRGSIGVILVYDITNRETFNNIGRWIDDTRLYANQRVSMMLVGNKSDLEFKRSVPYSEGQMLAKRHNMLFLECSAKTGQNVEGMFFSLTDNILDRIDKKEIDPRNEAIGVKVGGCIPNDEKRKEERGRCC